jgi:hypothetical protein
MVMGKGPTVMFCCCESPSFLLLRCRILCRSTRSAVCPTICITAELSCSACISQHPQMLAPYAVSTVQGDHAHTTYTSSSPLHIIILLPAHVCTLSTNLLEHTSSYCMASAEAPASATTASASISESSSCPSISRRCSFASAKSVCARPAADRGEVLCQQLHMALPLLQLCGCHVMYRHTKKWLLSCCYFTRPENAVCCLRSGIALSVVARSLT